MRLVYVNFFAAFSLLLIQNIYAIENCDIFQYVYENGDKIGQIIIPNDHSYKAVIKVSMFVNGYYPKNSNIKIVFKSAKEILNGDTPLLYNVYFPTQSSIPELSKIEFNDQVLCVISDKGQRKGALTYLWAGNQFSSNSTSSVQQVSTKYTTKIKCKYQEISNTAPDHSTKHSDAYNCTTLQTQNTTVHEHVNHKGANGK